MTSGPDDERRQPSEPTFADVMNGFSFDAGRSPRRRRWGRRRDEGDPTPGSEQARSEPVSPPTSSPMPNDEMYGYVTPPQPRSSVPHPQTTGPIDMRVVEPEQLGNGVGASAVRPYTWTRGRTKSGLELAIETLVSTSQRGRDQMGMLQVEHRAVAELCEQTRSVAEVAALMSLPLGVARVLLGDMAGLGVVTVHQTASSAGNAPDLALMERVLSGLRRL
ncbi:MULTISPECIES: DUF742 domain-containing protein [unclassified Pseudonocardia]|jgi:hypothetical protein|uniref:DUF742 domain-containing protein n=1 Tax=unclassified Pseudonocardia TaxID=2619320 RepID=UPI0009616BD4|nr:MULTISPECIES: DUF742 domain-containing protein [unclassified Pseudonocardia]MBN9103008.1 DUF742 domain-containing protein [Pseudonocardia sp.]OJY37446.1 MAG: hypothetical protein BGP03_18640 [Pseudonocardia sp. 73-21]